MNRETNESREKTVRRPDPARFYRSRQRITMGLLIFVVVVGLPIVAVPQLRGRLSTRVSTLKTAFSGEKKPAMLAVGENKNPFPAEYERPVPVGPRAPELPPLDRVFTMERSNATANAPVPARIIPRRERRIEMPPKAAEQQPEEQTAQASVQAEPSGEPEIKYQKGKVEQDAYDLLLKSNPKIGELVRGSDPSLKFKSWDAASKGDDIFWVRLRFQSEGNPDAEYIWQVKLQSNEVMPLSHNARSISE